MRSSRTPTILLIVLIAILLLTGYAFIHTENLVWSHAVNHQKFASYFTIFGALATAYSLFLLYRQVHIQNEQHRSSKQPDVFIENKQLFVEYAKAVGTFFYDDREHQQLAPQPTFIIKNCGNGIANNISVSWSIKNRDEQDIIVEYSNPIAFLESGGGADNLDLPHNLLRLLNLTASDYSDTNIILVNSTELHKISALVTYSDNDGFPYKDYYELRYELKKSLYEIEGSVSIQFTFIFSRHKAKRLTVF